MFNLGRIFEIFTCNQLCAVFKSLLIQFMCSMYKRGTRKEWKVLTQIFNHTLSQSHPGKSKQLYLILAIHYYAHHLFLSIFLSCTSIAFFKLELWWFTMCCKPSRSCITDPIFLTTKSRQCPNFIEVLWVSEALPRYMRVASCVAWAWWLAFSHSSWKIWMSMSLVLSLVDIALGVNGRMRKGAT